MKNDKLAYFIKNTNIFVEFNTKTSIYTVKRINNLETQGRRIAICNISPEEIFIYGGETRNSLSSAYILNLVGYKIETLKPGIPRHSSTPIVYNKKVYIFGGWTNKCLKNCNYFDLISKNWKDLSDLPSPQSDTSTVKLNKKILVSGYDNFLQLYNPEIDSFENLDSNINPKNKNILIKHGAYVYLLARNVYRINRNTLLFFEKTNMKVNFSMLSCRPIVRDNFAYFFDEDFNIYKFSFIDFSLKIIDKAIH